MSDAAFSLVPRRTTDYIHPRGSTARRRLRRNALMESTSSSLLLRLRRPGEQAAWQRFIDLYSPLLYFWACRMGLDVQDAADLVQDVFVALVQKMPQFQYDPGKSFRAWLRTVAENRWRDALRNGPRRRRTPAPKHWRKPSRRTRRPPCGRRNIINTCCPARCRSCGATSRRRPGRRAGAGSRGQIRGDGRGGAGHEDQRRVRRPVARPAAAAAGAGRADGLTVDRSLRERLGQAPLAERAVYFFRVRFCLRVRIPKWRPTPCISLVPF